jgi:hypothetical protein
MLSVDIDNNPNIHLDEFVLGINREEGKVKRKPATGYDWFNQLVEKEDRLPHIAPFLSPELKRSLVPLFLERRGQLQLLVEFGKAHPAFLEKLTFTSLRARSAHHFRDVSSLVVVLNVY